MTATDNYEVAGDEILHPFTDATPVTPDDAEDLSFVTRGVYVGDTGNLAVTMRSGAQVTFASVPAGALLKIRVSRIHATGTTALDIVALQ